MLASEDKEILERQTQSWSDRLPRFGLRLKIKSTETTDVNEHATIHVDGAYLGSKLSADGSLKQ